MKKIFVNKSNSCPILINEHQYVSIVMVHLTLELKISFQENPEYPKVGI
jgi:hypothetical protein